MNKSIYLRLPIQELSKILMYEFWYDYIKPKYSDKSKQNYMNVHCFILYLKIDNTDKDFA